MVKAIVTSIPVDQLASAQGIPEILAGITPYAERHYDRLDRLHTSSSYLLDFTLTSLGNLDPALDDASSEQDFAQWEASPKFVDGRIQVGGQAFIGKAKVSDDSLASGDNENDEAVSIGDSSTSNSSANQGDSDEEMQDADNQDPKDNGASSSRSSDNDHSN